MTLINDENVSTPTRNRLSKFEVFGLFDEFDYCIPFRIEDHVTAVIAPNGTGKTLCLRLIAALFKRKWSTFIEIEFSKLKFWFTNGSVLIITKDQDNNSENDETEQQEPFSILLKMPDGKTITWHPNNKNTRKAKSIDRYIPFITRISSSLWVHDHTGEHLSLENIIENYSDHLPSDIKSSLWGGDLPEKINEIMSDIECRLIETQRLLIFKDDDHEDMYYAHRQKPKSSLAITEKANSLKKIISQKINEYAALSQSLDRSFPWRVVKMDYNKEETGELENQLTNIDKMRKELMEAGILDTEVEDDPVALPEGPLDPAIARVLQVYAEDTETKLSFLSPLLAKIKLFKKLIDQRFITKDVQINRSSGIEVISRGLKISLDKLSSGEQHQLVLLFELLFEIKENSLILIDEPELSLHVAWQKKFIGDLLSIYPCD